MVSTQGRSSSSSPGSFASCGTRGAWTGPISPSSERTAPPGSSVCDDDALAPFSSNARRPEGINAIASNSSRATGLRRGRGSALISSLRVSIMPRVADSDRQGDPCPQRKSATNNQDGARQKKAGSRGEQDPAQEPKENQRQGVRSTPAGENTLFPCSHPLHGCLASDLYSVHSLPGCLCGSAPHFGGMDQKSLYS